MREDIAFLITLKNRVDKLKQIHFKDIPQEEFEKYRDQFIEKSEELMDKHHNLSSFKPATYKTQKIRDGGYEKWSAQALIDDIDFFLTYLLEVQEDSVPSRIQLNKQGMFFAGQYFDALQKVNDILGEARQKVILIDGYVDSKVLKILSSTNDEVKLKILTKSRSITEDLSLLINEFNKQHNNRLEVKSNEDFHDRFLIVDDESFFHFGASIKDAGHRGFMFSRIEEDFIKAQLLEEFRKSWS